MNLYGLIGYPLSHSFSKKFFEAKFEKEGMAGYAYENFPIESIDKLPAMLGDNPDLKGFNVTIPYKEQVIPFLDLKDEVVARIGACNCVRVENGKLSGFNTDVYGFETSLKKYLKPYHTKALVLGSGGAAKAVAYVLKTLRIDYLYVSRKSSPGVDHQLKYHELTADIMQSHLLIINTTPLGMYPAVETAPPLDYNQISSHHYLFDLVYNPEKTVFLLKGEARGAAIQNGHDMLILQAEESWRIWNS